MRTIYLLLLLGVGTLTTAQKFHTPSEIFQIMSDSKIMYGLSVVDSTFECQNYQNNTNQHNVYRVQSDSGFVIKTINIKDVARPLFNKAENYFSKQVLDSAIIFYKMALSVDSTIYPAITYIGQAYGIMGDYNNAAVWYKTAIEKNYIDYMAHWFLADIYLRQKKYDLASDEIIVARILNRNNSRIKKSMTNIFSLAKRDTLDWDFCPQYEIVMNNDSNYTIKAQAHWLGYALGQAVWNCEPGYAEQMGTKPNHHTFIEYKECTISLYAGISNEKIKDKTEPALATLKKCAPKGLIDAYIIYEIILPQNPSVGYNLSDELIADIKSYILNYRNK